MANEVMSAGQLLKQANRLKREGQLEEAYEIEFASLLKRIYSNRQGG